MPGPSGRFWNRWVDEPPASGVNYGKTLSGSGNEARYDPDLRLLLPLLRRRPHRPRPGVDPRGQPPGVVQLVHGVAEHIGRYGPVARFLAAHGYVVCGEDHLGHGLTAGGKFGYFGPKNGWDLVARDVYRLRELEGEKHPKLPYVILGHSMGSFLTRTCLIRWPGTVNAAVLSGTGQESAAAVAFGKALSSALCKTRGPDYVSKTVNDLSLGAYNKTFKPNRTSSDWISRDGRR